MEKINTKDIHLTNHKVDGFSLSYITDNGNYYTQRYIFYSLKEAKRLFIEYLKNTGELK